MISASTEFKNSIEQGNHRYLLNIDITTTENIIIPTINEEKIVEFSVEDAVSDDENFSSLGGVVIGLATIVLDNSDEAFTNYKFKNASVSIELGLIISQGTSSISEYIDYGIYTVDTCEYVGNKIRLLCLDNMVKFDDRTFSETLLTQFPITIQQIVDDACTVCGVTLQGVVPYASEYLNVRPSGEVTYREILQSIAQLTGTFAKINKQGKLYFNWFDVTHLNQAYNDGTIIPDISNVIYLDGDKIASIVPQQHNTMITGVKASIIEGGDLVEYIAGTDEFAIDISNNIFLESINVQTLLNRIYADISGLVIRGLTVEHLNNPLYESGDVGITAYKIDRLNSNALQYCPFVITRTVFAINKLQETVCGIESDTNSNRSATRDKIYLQTARQINEYDKTLDTEEVFNRLTNNGEAEGIFYEDGQIYINMSYLQTGTIKLGGSNNINGSLQVYNAQGQLATIIDNTMINTYWLASEGAPEYLLPINLIIGSAGLGFWSGSSGVQEKVGSQALMYDATLEIPVGISCWNKLQYAISVGSVRYIAYSTEYAQRVSSPAENVFYGTEYHYGNTTYAGILTIPKMESNKRAYIIKNLHMKIDSPPSEDILSGSFCFTDINAESLGAVDVLQKDNGQNVTRIMSWTKINDTYYYHGLGIGVDSTGNPVVIMFGNSGSGPAAWRSAINAVNKSGDTLSGNFRFVTNETGAQTLAIQSKVIELGITPAQTVYSGRLRFGDTDNALLGYVDAEYSTAKRSLIRMLGYNVIGGTQYYNGFGVGVDANGNASVILYSNVSGTSPSTAWRTAIGAVNKAGDTMTGNLNIKKTSPETACYSTNIDLAVGQTIPSTATIVGGFQVNDKQNWNSGWFRIYKNENDLAFAQMTVRRSVSGSTIMNSLTIGVNANGTRYVSVSESAVWRKALSIPTDFSITSVDASITVNATVASSTQTTASGINTSNYKILGIVGYHVQGSDRMYLTLNEVRMDGANIKWGISNRKSSQVTATVTFKILKVAL